MRILVTGAAGFVGSHVCRALAMQGHSVLAAVRPRSSTRRLDALAVEAERVELDVFDPDLGGLDRVVDGVERAVHAAWFAVPGAYLTSAENVTALHGTLRLMAALWRAGCHKITGVGTCLEYHLSDRPARETDPCKPASLYAAAKYSTWLVGGRLAAQLGGGLAWARLFYLYGPHESPSRLVADLAANLLRGRRVAVTEGSQVRDYLHVEDVASAIATVALGDCTGPVNIGSGRATTVRNVIETLGRLTGGADLVDYGARQAVSGDVPYAVADISKLSSLGGWTPTYSLESGLARTVEWWRTFLRP